MLDVTLIPVLDDNYAYILQSGSEIAVLDPGEAQPVIEYLEKNKLIPSIIFNTHHHGDHIAGNKKIQEKYNSQIVGPEKDKSRIPNINIGLNEGDIYKFGDEDITIMETPGHTNGHICLWFKQSKILFSGDTLFAMGCGRLFEGTADDIFPSFVRFNQMPDETTIYCGHEYTLENARFCLSIEPENDDLIERMKEVEGLYNNEIPTIPTTIGLERKTNVFMRAKDVAEFKKYRTLKDRF